MERTLTSTLLTGVAIGLCSTAALASAPGARPGDTTVGQTRVVPPGQHQVLPPKGCKLKGTWENTYGATITMTSSKKGQYSASYCGAPWTVARTAHSKTGFSVAMTYTGTGECTDFTETMTWNGCSEATGHFTNPDGVTGPDTWTKSDGHAVK